MGLFSEGIKRAGKATFRALEKASPQVAISLREADTVGSLKGAARQISHEMASPESLFLRNPILAPFVEQANHARWLEEEFLSAGPRKLLQKARSLGVKEGSDESRTIFRALERGADESELRRLTPEQRGLIDEFRGAWKQHADDFGIPVEDRISNYGPHYLKDVHPNDFDARRLLNHVPDHVPFKNALKRSGMDIPYIEDVMLAYERYTKLGAKSRFRTPVVAGVNEYIDDLIRSGDFLMANGFRKWVKEAYLGHRAPSFVTDTSHAIRGLTYKATLFGNLGAATTNWFQPLLLAYPEIGGGPGFRNLKGLVKGMFKWDDADKAILAKSGIKSLTDDIHKLDFMMRVERRNQGTAYLVKYKDVMARATAKKMDPVMADNLARRQAYDFSQRVNFFNETWAPAFARRPLVGQFSQFPLRTVDAIGGWAKQAFTGATPELRREGLKKLWRFFAVSYAIAGPRTFTDIPVISSMIEQNDDVRAVLDTWEFGKRFTDNLPFTFNIPALLSQAGMGVNMAPRFGFGIVPGMDANVAWHILPAVLPRMVIDSIVAISHGREGLERFQQRYAIDPKRPILNYLPSVLIPGGIEVRRLATVLENWSQGGVRDARGRLIFETTAKKEISRLFGQPLEEARAYRGVRVATDVIKAFGRAKRDVVDTILTGNSREASRMVRAWNLAHPDQPLSVTSADLRLARRRAEAPLTERILEAAPRAVRPKVGRIIGGRTIFDRLGGEQ